MEDKAKNCTYPYNNPGNINIWLIHSSGFSIFGSIISQPARTWLHSGHDFELGTKCWPLLFDKLIWKSHLLLIWSNSQTLFTDY